jgi:hypothetical protein
LACNHKESNQQITVQSSAARTNDPQRPLPVFTSAERPIYAAQDYGKPGQPVLTSAQKEQIDKVLALSKPCQRPLLAYAFPENVSFLPFVLFFRGNGHIIGQRNVYYDEREGLASAYGAAAPPPSADISYDIAHTKCESSTQ